jgi:hypothetical protein
MLVVKLEDNTWIAPWEGDPGRTTQLSNAAQFADQAAAEKALAVARTFRPFKNAIIEETTLTPRAILEKGTAIAYGEVIAVVEQDEGGDTFLVNCDGEVTQWAWEHEGVTCTVIAPPPKGFFVDWDGNTRRVEAPGDGYTCQVIDKPTHRGVDVITANGFVHHECTFFETLDDVEKAGVTINLI